MEKITAQESLRRIPIALKNLKVSSDLFSQLNNYIFNLILVVLNDDELREQLNSDKQKTLEQLAKL